MTQPWWEYWPQVYQREIDAFNAANIRWQEDVAARAKGILRFHIVLPREHDSHELIVDYPDAYPYFRFQVIGKNLKLDFHQNPFEHNLCLIGRRTHWWNQSDTAAGLILEQLGDLLKTANATDKAAVVGVEEIQAEPYSDYYRYEQSMILVQNDWSISKEHRWGHLVIGLLPYPGRLPGVLIRGAVLDVLAADGTVLCSASPQIRRVHSAGPFDGRWYRSNEPIAKGNAGEFIQELFNTQSELRQARYNHALHKDDDGWLRVWGVLFPEQVAHRSDGLGWVFACAVDKKLPKTGNIPRPHFQKPNRAGDQRPKGQKRR